MTKLNEVFTVRESPQTLPFQMSRAEAQALVTVIGLALNKFGTPNVHGVDMKELQRRLKQFAQAGG